MGQLRTECNRMSRRTKRSDSTSITSIALSLRATRSARHSWVNSSNTLTSGISVHRGCGPRRSRRTRRDCAAVAAAGCTIRLSTGACRAWVLCQGLSAPASRNVLVAPPSEWMMTGMISYSQFCPARAIMTARRLLALLEEPKLKSLKSLA
jgi:hypothetical protein